MKILAQSQVPTRTGFIHLAYISASMSNGISKGDLFPGMVFLGLAVTFTLAGGALAARLARTGAKKRMILVGLLVGLIGGMALLYGIEHLWGEFRGNDAVVKHVVQTDQFWALRDQKIAAGVEAAAATNGAAAALAAEYYALSPLRGELEHPEIWLKAYRYCEMAAALGHTPHYVQTDEFAREFGRIEKALESGKLSSEETAWAKQKLKEETR